MSERMDEQMNKLMNGKINNRMNKAKYTANTSCGRVGKGGNARFHTFQLDHYGRMDRRTDRPTDGQSLL